MKIKWKESAWTLREAGISDQHEAKIQAAKLFVFYRTVVVKRDASGKSFAILTRGDKQS
jgi:hypothetical protein